MVYLVIGTRDSGKSALAEKLAAETGDPVRVYLATMKILDQEGEKRVMRHRQMREGKGFVTWEKERSITEVRDRIESPDRTTLLLECVSNLVGNELYDGSEGKAVLQAGEASVQGSLKAEFAERIASDIESLAGCCKNIVIVTNEYEADADGYDDETRLYVELLHMVNERLRVFADEIHDLRKEVEG